MHLLADRSLQGKPKTKTQSVNVSSFILLVLELWDKVKLTEMSSSKRRAVLTESPLVNWVAFDMGTS